jgi:AcrR family transcriptional regulator
VRADARENLDRILAAAARLFAQDGADTSLKAIALEADVGIATLYRRFPTREDLVEATYRNETERLGRRADELLATAAPDDALREWMDAFVDYMFTKKGMSEALRAAIDRILRAAVAADLLRDDVPAEDVMMAIGGVTLIAGHEHQRALADRLLDLVLAGLRNRP